MFCADITALLDYLGETGASVTGTRMEEFGPYATILFHRRGDDLDGIPHLLAEIRYLIDKGYLDR